MLSRCSNRLRCCHPPTTNIVVNVFCGVSHSPAVVTTHMLAAAFLAVSFVFVTTAQVSESPPFRHRIRRVQVGK